MHFRPWAVGLFVTLGLALFVAILFIIGNRQEAFTRKTTYQTQFRELSGLTEGAKVRVSGVDAGKIKKIELPRSASEKFRLVLEVEAKLHPMIRTDSVASIATEGVVGNKYVEVGRGSEQAAEAQPDTMLLSKEPFELSVIMEQANGLLKDVKATIGDVRGRVDTSLDSITRTVDRADGLVLDVSPNVRKITRDSSHITGNVDSLVTDLNAGKGPVGLLLRDEETRRQLQAAMENLRQTSMKANDAAGHANQLIADFQSRGLAEKTQTTLANAQSVTEQLNSTLREALAEDTMGEDGASNIRQSLSNFNRTSANLADDTEALKHNFFFRGFFKKRGFFSTDQIAPADYRTAVAQHKVPASRMWIQAAGLVAPGPNGKDQLTPEGRRGIDIAVTPELDRLAGHLIVVEGYAATGSPADQFSAGKQRADQVRRYLEMHYHLRHSDIGVVALGSKPPLEAGKAEWDGAAIVLIETKSKK
jgi:phospholipid/cholesterol/gamma-HCH transport system substrate-binding protein